MTGRPPALQSGVTMHCPQCGRGKLFASYLRLAPKCDVCGADFAHADPGDGPAVFVVLVVGAIVTPLLFILQFAFHLPELPAVGLTMAAAVLLCLAFLPLFKSTLFALQWKHKASEARFDDGGGER